MQSVFVVRSAQGDQTEYAGVLLRELLNPHINLTVHHLFM